MTKRVYLAGPMRGYPQYNYPAFDIEAYKLRRMGWEVFSPAEHTRSLHGEDWGKDSVDGNGDTQEFMRQVLGADLAYICQHADAVAFMKGWEKSNGARAEHAAAVALGLEMIYL